MAVGHETSNGPQQENRRNHGDRYQHDDFLIHIVVFVVRFVMRPFDCGYATRVRLLKAGICLVPVFVSCSSPTLLAKTLHRLVRLLQAQKCLVFAHIGRKVWRAAKIWDIVPVSVMLPEGGGKFTDLKSKKITFLPNEPEHSYAVLGASLALHSQIRALPCRA